MTSEADKPSAGTAARCEVCARVKGYTAANCMVRMRSIRERADTECYRLGYERLLAGGPPAGPPGVEVPSAPSGDLAVLLAEARREIERLTEAGRVFVIAMQNLHCTECGVQWGADSPDSEGDERCEGCEARHAEVRAASLAFFPPSASPAHPPESP